MTAPSAALKVNLGTPRMSAHSCHIRLSSMRVSPTSNTIPPDPRPPVRHVRHRTTARRSPAGPAIRTAAPGASSGPCLGAQLPVLVDERLGVLPGDDGELAVVVALERRDAQPREAALGETEDVALAAQLEVLLGQGEPVLRLDQGLQPRPGDRVLRVRDEHAERLDGAAAHPAAELVELGQPEPLGALDDHHRGLRHVDPDLDDRGATRMSISPSRKRAISASRSDGRRRPWTIPTRCGARRAVRRSFSDSAATAPPARSSASSSPVPASPPWTMSGTTTNVRRPAAASARTLSHVPSSCEGCFTPVLIGDPPGRRSAQVGHIQVGIQHLADGPGIGVAVMSRTWGRARGLRLELAPLLDAEAVLLVDDDHPRSAKGRIR